MIFGPKSKPYSSFTHSLSTVHQVIELLLLTHNRKLMMLKSSLSKVLVYEAVFAFIGNSTTIAWQQATSIN